jgi:hypothetical protein
MGERYVLIVLNPVQPRPIMMQTEGASIGKTHFRPGEIWIKHNTRRTILEQQNGKCWNARYSVIRNTRNI